MGTAERRENFRLEARVSERTDSNTFVVCEAIQVTLFHKSVPIKERIFCVIIMTECDAEHQKVPGSDDVVKGTPVQRPLNIFYPPQVKILT